MSLADKRKFVAASAVAGKYSKSNSRRKHGEDRSGLRDEVKLLFAFSPSKSMVTGQTTAMGLNYGQLKVRELLWLL